jgi:hypothetical protein
MFAIPENAPPIMRPAANSPATLTSGYLQQRLLIYYGAATVAILAAIALFYLLPIPAAAQGTTLPAMSKHVYATFFALPVFFVFGVLITVLHRGRDQTLLLIDFILSSLTLLALSLVLLALSPAKILIFPYLFLLLLHAALVPHQVWVQAGLSAVAVASYIGMKFAAVAFFSDNMRAYLGVGDDGFWRSTVLSILFLAINAFLLVYIVRKLEAVRRSVCEDRRFGNYVIENFIGTGGMGKVYRARHVSMLRPTALKIMQPKNEDISRAIQRFEREVKLSSTLCHPNTITIYDFGRCDDFTYYYAMEFLVGMDLQRLVEKFGPMPAPRIVHLLKQACGSLSEAHQRGIVHRDIKPSNIFLCVTGGVFDFVKVLDFGLAKEMETASESLTSTNAFLGTPSYVAPEMILDRDKVDGRTDIYMLGCVAYWLLTGHPPFEGGTDAQTLVEHVNNLPKWPSDQTRQDIPPEFERIVMRCLEKEMDRRYQSSAELCAALDELDREKPWLQNQAREWWNRNLPLGDPILTPSHSAA